MAEPERTPIPLRRQRPQPASEYTPEQDAALDRIARLIASVLERQLDEQRPDLARRRIKS